MAKKHKRPRGRKKNKTPRVIRPEPKKLVVPGGLVRPITPYEQRLMGWLSRFPLPPWHPDAASIRAHVEPTLAQDVEIQRQFAELQRRFPLYMTTQLQGGSGLLMSETLRSYVGEYTNRLHEHGPHMPSSFNIVEAFLNFRPEYMAFELRRESEHLLTCDDYFSWYTTNDMPLDTSVLITLLEEGTVYSYDMAGDASGYRIAHEASTLVIAGVSLVRHGNHVSCILLAGENPPYPSDAEVEAVASAGRDNVVMSTGRQGIAPAPDLTTKDRYLDRFPEFGRVVLLTRFDVAAKKFDFRYVNVDIGQSYNVYTDDHELIELSFPGGPRNAEAKALAKEGVNRYQDLFSALTTLIYLPQIFVEEHARVSSIAFSTELSSHKGEKQTRDAMKVLGPKECCFHRTVRCLASECESEQAAMPPLTLPELEFESTGYWRPLEPGEIGEDRDGRPIVGKTWVDRRDTWPVPRGPESLLLQRPTSLPDGPDPGVVYVLRCPGHEVDVFKIGLTRRSATIRASQLGTTGVPLPFEVLVKWDVGDCAAVEAEAHRQLEPYRLSPRREFFRVGISRIINTIEGIIRA